MGTPAQRWHLLTLLAGLAGIVLSFTVSLTTEVNVNGVAFATSTRLWNWISYFTIWSNILVTVVAALLALDARRGGRVFAVLRLTSLVMITVTFFVYQVVLAGAGRPSGLALASDLVVHALVPVVAVLGFLVVGPRPRLGWTDLAWSLAIPGIWVAYTLVRGPHIDYVQDGRPRQWYPYPFLDVHEIGYGTALRNVALVAVLLLAIGALLVWLDHRMRPAPRPV